MQRAEEAADAEVRGQLIQAQALAELRERELRERDDALRVAERSAADEKGLLARSLRQAMARAEACETAAEAASDDCSVASTIVSAARSTGAQTLIADSITPAAPVPCSPSHFISTLPPSEMPTACTGA